MLNISIRYLRTFVAVVECRTYDAAALIVHSSPNSLGVHIKKVEESVGFPIMQKFQRYSVPTELGEKLYQKAKVLIQAHDDFVSETKELSKDIPPTYQLNKSDTLTQRKIMARKLNEQNHIN